MADEEKEGISQVDYDTLMQVVFNAAVGENEPTAKQQTLVRRTEDGQLTEVRTKEEPNIALAMKLLDQRIGGPQDFC